MNNNKTASLTATIVDGNEILVTIDQQTHQPIHWIGPIFVSEGPPINRILQFMARTKAWLIERTSDDGYEVVEDWIDVDDHMQQTIKTFYWATHYSKSAILHNHERNDE